MAQDATATADTQAKAETAECTLLDNTGKLSTDQGEVSGAALTPADKEEYQRALLAEADKFVNNGRTRTCEGRMWWQKRKVKLMLAVAINTVLAIIVFAFVCFSGGNCLTD